MNLKSAKIFLSLNLKLLSLSILIGLFACAISIFAFSSPGSNQPPNGTPNFWLVNGSSMYYSGGNVGIGTSNPSSTFALEVNGAINATSFYKNGSLFSNIPANAVIAFNQTTCPAGWILADGTSGTPDLRGMFIRGAGTNGTRTLANGTSYYSTFGTYQDDTYQGHNMLTTNGTIQFKPAGNAAYGPAYIGGVDSSGNAVAGQFQTTVHSSDGTNGAPRVGGETRPANYALIYCVKT